MWKFWGEYHPMNTSETLYGEKQTNNRAEMTAAIIAIRQALQIHLESVTICTDSRYVKDGITKWMKVWKVNNRKTQNGIVLNQDLWLILDSLSTRTEIEWIWIEGRKSEGNITADPLVKQGISSESVYWQVNYPLAALGSIITDDVAQQSRPTYVERVNINDTLQNIKSSYCSLLNDNAQITNNSAISSLCSFCAENVTEHQNAIHCGDCKKWCHFRCTRLPQYQLHVFRVLSESIHATSAVDMIKVW